MLENIKLMLGLDNDKYDDMIMLYLAKVETVVVEYCNVSSLSGALTSFVEDKVVSIMKAKVGGGTQNTGEVKSVTRGDTKIEYNVGDAIVDTSSGAMLTESDRKFLNKFRVMRCF